MRVSRTARILFAILLLAAASFFWVNFFYQNQGSTLPALVGGAEGAGVGLTADAEPPAGGAASTEVAAASTAPSEAAPSGEVALADATQVAPGDAGAVTTAAMPDGPGAVDGPQDGDLPPAVVAPEGADVVSRDLVVADLPFLISSPPGAGTDADADAAGGGVGRPNGALRATVNPFSPILGRPAEVVAEQPAPPAAAPEVTTVEVPAAPTPTPTPAAAAVRTPVNAPAPGAIAPPSARAGALPRQLPTGTLPVAPDILRSARVTPQEVEPVVAVEEVATSAAVREPGTSETVLGDVAVPEMADADDADALAPIGPGQVREPVPQPVTGDPLAAGISPLSRYLRDNNFSFTGSVLGPVSVGVFRSNIGGTPIVISLGQSLPDTDIVLTDLRGQQAELTQNDSRQILTLDLRR